MACVISLIDPNKNKVLKSLKIDDNYKNAENRVQELNKKINKKDFAEEVFAREDEETQNLLLHLALLDSLPLEVCSALFPAMRLAAHAANAG